MPFVICEKHGGGVAPMVCPHLGDAIHAEQPELTSIKVIAWFDDEQAWAVHLCETCAKEHQLPWQDIDLKEDDALERIFEIDQGPICARCFEEWSKTGTRTQ
jgi:hypothetical protein